MVRIRQTMLGTVAVLSVILSCFFVIPADGNSLEMVRNSRQIEDDQLVNEELSSLDALQMTKDDNHTTLTTDTVLLLQQSSNISTTSTSSTETNDFGCHYRQLQRLRRETTVSNDDDDDDDDQDDEDNDADRDDNDNMATSLSSSSSTTGSSFSSDEVGWSNINEQVDMVIPMVVAHLQKLGLAHLDLPDMKEKLSVKPLFITYSAELLLNKGVAFNLDGIQRHGDALMTYSDKSFICRFYLLISRLEFNYDFLINLMGIEGYGKVVGSLDDTVIYADLSINVEDTRLRLNDFRIVKFRNIQVQLSQRRFIQELSGVILSPITNLFRDRITTSISDGLKDQMQEVMDDFNDNDPLELTTFAKQMLAGLMGQR